MKPQKDDEEPGPGGGSGGRRGKSEPRRRRVELLRRSLDKREQDVNQVQGCIARARGHLQQGDYAQARRCASEARQVAIQHVGGPPSTSTQHGSTEEIFPKSPKRFEL